MNIHRLKEVLAWAKHWQKWLETQISIKKEIPLNNLTRRLNKAMRTTLLNCDPDELTRLSSTVSLDTWQTIGRLLRTDVTLHPGYRERVIDGTIKDVQDKEDYFNKAFDEKLAQQERATRHSFSNVDMEYYKLESGIPMPGARSTHKLSGTKRPIAHFLKTMDIGDSVLVPTFNSAKGIYNLFLNSGKKVKIRTVEINKAYRVWRVK